MPKMPEMMMSAIFVRKRALFTVMQRNGRKNAAKDKENFDKDKRYNGECHAQLQKNAAGEQYLFQHTGRTCVFAIVGTGVCMVANAREVAALRQVEMQKEKEAQEKKKLKKKRKSRRGSKGRKR